MRKFGEKHCCPRCRWMRRKRSWCRCRELVYTDREGNTATWVEEKCTADHPWGLGCKVCRWHGLDTAWGQTRVRGQNGTRFVNLKRHAQHETHARAQAALLDNSEVNPPSSMPDRNDVPCFAMCYTAYKGAKAGASFKSYEADLEATRACGAPIPRSRGSREVAKQIVTSAADVLREEDAQLLKHATNIHLSMDARKSGIVVRGRLTLGNGWPPGMGPTAWEREGDRGAEVNPTRRIRNAFGKCISTVDRLISFRRFRPYDTTEELAQHLVDAVKVACGSEDVVWQNVRTKVNGVTPDGAADEQLAGRLSAEDFPNLRLVLRCSTHAVVGAIKAGWSACETADRITKTIVQEVAKYIRSSERFAMRLGAKAAEEAVAAVSNFSFAPQRFHSRERPMTRFVLFARAILEVLALEVHVPTSPERKKWAANILKELTGETWAIIGMMADLSDDCARFVAHLDERLLDPMDFAQDCISFIKHLEDEYIHGRMWLRKKDTYTKRVMDMLRTAKVVQFGSEYTVVQRPTKQESEVAQARVANVASGIKLYMHGQFPDFSPQLSLFCFKIPAKSPAAASPNTLQRLLTILGWRDAKKARCIAEYVEGWPTAVAIKRAENLSDRDTWAKLVVEVSPQSTALKDVVCLALNFLLTETECERSFSAERRQHDHPPRLGAGARFAGLKIMTDGLEFEELQHDGQPVDDFWLRVQSRYADRFGCRCLRTVMERKDKGAKRKLQETRGGKQTVTDFKRRRAVALQKDVRIPFGSHTANVFGHVPLAALEMERLRLAEQTHVFQKIADRARATYNKKKEEHVAVCAGGPGASLCKLAPKKLKNIRQNMMQKRKAFGASAIAGEVRWTWITLMRSLGGTGDPWIF